MKTLEDLEKQHQKEREQFIARDALLKSLPAGIMTPVKQIFFVGKGKDRPWVIYEVQKLTEVGHILIHYGTLETVSAIESGCLSVDVVGEHGKDYFGKEPRFVVPECVSLNQFGGTKFYTATVTFWPVVPRVHVKIEVKNLPFQMRVRAQFNYNRHGEMTSKQVEEPSLKASPGVKRISYGGHGLESYDVRYFWTIEDFKKAVLNAKV